MIRSPQAFVAGGRLIESDTAHDSRNRLKLADCSQPNDSLSLVVAPEAQQYYEMGCAEAHHRANGEAEMGGEMQRFAVL